LRKLAPYFLVLLFAGLLCDCVGCKSRVAPCINPASDDQTANKPDPGFRLLLSKGFHGGEIAATTTVLDVKYTNTSNAIDYGHFCARFGEIYRLDVVYNGIPVKEPKEVTRRRVALQSGFCREAEGPGRNLQPGQSGDDILYYDTTKPGTYTFTADVDTDPLDPDDNVRVRSNTVTIVVPAIASTGTTPRQ
jgi:hypothetical protein